MGSGNELLVVFVTVSSPEEASRISVEVLNSHQAACATTIPTVQSQYWWDGKLVKEQESIVMFKTTEDRFKALEKTILNMHSYQVPEIIALPVVSGFPQYLEWVKKETSQ
jgi:periplasmic divalent cation tolerance protein